MRVTDLAVTQDIWHFESFSYKSEQNRLIEELQLPPQIVTEILGGKSFYCGKYIFTGNLLIIKNS